MNLIERLENLRKKNIDLPLELKTVSSNIFDLIENHMKEMDKYDVARRVYYSRLKGWNVEGEFYYLDEHKSHILSISSEKLIEILEKIEKDNEKL